MAIPRPLAHAAPSALTLTALACSLTSMKVAWAQEFEQTAGLIIAAAICDALDGHVARLLDTVSVFGGELDSLCDLVNFGVAPALGMHSWARAGIPAGGPADVFLWASCVIFCQACAYRLARFNSSPGGPSHQGNAPSHDAARTAGAGGPRRISRAKFFTGVPAPMGALMALIPLFWYLATKTTPFGLQRYQVAIPTLLVTAVLMVSTLKTLSSKMLVRDPKASHLRIASPWEALLKLALVFGALGVWVQTGSPWRLVLALETLYIISLCVGPIVYTHFAE